ncbi:NfeD family protein [Treponema sp.]|uniref:NfeD family protein n=1 Tax=Treponema sp. TaxID=166 RepID=UPI003F1076E9
MGDFFFQNMPWLWLFFTIIFLVIEAFTLSLTTIWAAISSLALIFISMARIDIKWQILIFMVFTIILLVSTRSFVLKKLNPHNGVNAVNSIVGQEVTITRKIEDSKKYEGKTQNGVTWTVVADSPEELNTNDICIIEEISGNTLKVSLKK